MKISAKGMFKRLGYKREETLYGLNAPSGNPLESGF